MNVIRIGAWAVLIAGVSGCAVTKPELMAESPEIRSEPKPEKSAPAKAPVIVASRELAAQAPQQTVQPAYVPQQRIAQPRYLPVKPPQARAAPRAAAPMVDTGPLDRPVAYVPRAIPLQQPAPRAVPLPQIASTFASLFEPSRYEPAEEPRYEPLAVPAAPSYEPEPQTSYVETALLEPGVASSPTSSREMTPIYDDPQDGAGRGRAEARVHARKGYRPGAAMRRDAPPARVRSAFTPEFGDRLASAAMGRLNPSVRYDARYVKIGYPWGDVPKGTGVCTDVVIRSYRKLGIDLQQLVHEDMRTAFVAYPSKRIYGLREADPNIDHRRVVNLEAFFERVGASVPVGASPEDFRPGDVVTWRLSGNEPHTGIVIAERDPRSGYPLVVHNLGAGVRKDDLLSLDRPVGQYRFSPDTDSRLAMLRSGSARNGG